jgi:hypothetical protein
MSYSKISSILLYVVFGISILVVLFFYFGDNLINEEEFAAKVEQMDAPEQMTGPDYMQDLGQVKPASEDTSLTFMERMVYKKTDIALTWSYILLIIAAIFALAFPVARMFTNPAMLVRALIGLVVLAGLILGAYALGSDTALSITGYDGTDNRDPQVLKMVDTGLIITYFFLGLAMFSILYTEIAKYFK